MHRGASSTLAPVLRTMPRHDHLTDRNFQSTVGNGHHQCKCSLKHKQVSDKSETQQESQKTMVWRRGGFRGLIRWCGKSHLQICGLNSWNVIVFCFFEWLESFDFISLFLWEVSWMWGTTWMNEWIILESNIACMEQVPGMCGPQHDRATSRSPERMFKMGFSGRWLEPGVFPTKKIISQSCGCIPQLWPVLQHHIFSSFIAFCSVVVDHNAPTANAKCQRHCIERCSWGHGLHATTHDHALVHHRDTTHTGQSN